MKRVLVLGSTGMLGSMVHRVFADGGRLAVTGTDRASFDAEAFVRGERQRADLAADYVINCIGVIKPYCKDDDAAGVARAIAVNAQFPHRLGAAARQTGARVIQIATDCVYSGAKGRYVESDPHDALDVYGKSKSLGEVFDRSVLNVRCSIIGPELKSKVSLLEWFLANPEGASLNGFTHHHWNGVTTLQFAQLCEAIIAADAWDRLVGTSPLHHFVPNSTVTKHELLQLMADVYRRKVTVRAVDSVGPPVDRTLASNFSMLTEWHRPMSMRDALTELHGSHASRV